jgi:alkylation response protein AidB-like acyl-CoA dehydrogenase
MPVDRLLPSDDAVELIALTRDIADKVLDPIVDAHEKSETYPDGVFAQLGAAGLLSLPQPEEWGGACPSRRPVRMRRHCGVRLRLPRVATF